MTTASDSGYEAYKRSIQQVHVDIATSFDALTTSFAMANHADRLAAAEYLFSQLAFFGRILHSEYHPKWHKALMGSLSLFLDKNNKDPDNGAKLLRTMMNVEREMKAWKLSDGPPPPVSIDAIFEETLEASQIPTLFDTLANKLAELIETGLLDKFSSIKRLNELIELLRTKNSYAAKWTLWQLATIAVPKILAEVAEADARVGPIKRGVEKALYDLGLEWSDVSSRVADCIKDRFGIDLRETRWGKVLNLSNADTIDGICAPSPAAIPAAIRSSEDVGPSPSSGA
jgi:hypothetical protein